MKNRTVRFDPNLLDKCDKLGLDVNKICRDAVNEVLMKELLRVEKIVESNQVKPKRDKIV